MRKVSPGFVIWRSDDLSALVQEASQKRVFVSSNQSSTENLLKAGLRLSRGGRMAELLTLEPPRPESVPSLSGLFERVVGACSGYSWLPVEELMTVVSGFIAFPLAPLWGTVREGGSGTMESRFAQNQRALCR